MRLDKYLAHAGIGTRKQVKLLIRKKHICVNGIICNKDDTKIHEQVDRITLDGEDITYEPKVYIMLHKPQGVVCATVDELHTTVFECIDAILPNDCFPVGRLDIDTEGLLLICNDGKLAHALLSPKKHVDKTYEVTMAHALSYQDIHKLESGTIRLDEGCIQPAVVEYVDSTFLRLTIQEGRFHQVKRMLHAVNNEVLHLKRIRMGTLVLDCDLQPGTWRYLTKQEIAQLYL